MLTNAQMKAGRFAKLAKGRSLYRKMNAVWNVGGTVWLSTATRRTEIKAKHRDCVKLDSRGDLFVSRGKAWDCFTNCPVGFTAPVERHAEVRAILGLAA